MTIQCPSCQAVLPDSRKECPVCGALLDVDTTRSGSKSHNPAPPSSEQDLLVTAPVAPPPSTIKPPVQSNVGGGTAIFGPENEVPPDAPLPGQHTPKPERTPGGGTIGQAQSMAMAGLPAAGKTVKFSLGQGPAAGGSSPGNKLMLSTSVIDLGRFVPGTLLGGRYRIIGRLGKGGMGEVYRADDLKLGQPVAMKFLPEELSADEVALTRLVNEVKIARQVSHPNVCRVYDIGDIENVHFISMEYVDGEDLGTLLKRIGRLPSDKAIQIARQMCAGLMSAHERGVLHRDLKPANIMIDGKGAVRIMDFGLAGLAEELKSTGSRAGTPAYMSPEQLHGSGVTPLSDLYSLGLVMYEIFTGKPVYRPQSMAELVQLHEKPPPPLSTVVPDIPPAVDRVVLRCLDRDPAMRPPSALAVSAALPGSDPLAAALAAGELPSPELVAASGGRGTMSIAAASGLLGAVVAGVLLVGGLNRAVRLVEVSPTDQPPVVLVSQAKRLLTSIGAGGSGGDRAWGFIEERHEQEKESPEPSSAELRFWYRYSASAMLPASASERNRLSPTVPPLGDPGSALVVFDAGGRLVELEVHPFALAAAAKPAEPAWEDVLKEAGAPPTVRVVQPSKIPPVLSDAQRAWEWDTPEGDQVRAEGASMGGRPVSFRVQGKAAEPKAEATTSQEASQFAGSLVLWVLLHLGPAALAIWNVWNGRGDRKGSARLAIAVFTASFLSLLLQTRAVASPQFVNLMQDALGAALYQAGLAWIVYTAVEPMIRKVWPQSLISWSRLLAGEVRDGLVGRDLLMGCGLGVAWTLLAQALYLLPTGSARPVPRPVDMATLDGVREALGVALGWASLAVLLTLVMLFLVPISRWIAKKHTASDLLVGALFAFGFLVLLARQTGQNSSAGLGAVAVAAVVVAGVTVYILTRLGALMLMGAFFTAGILDRFPITLDFSRWYSSISLVGMALILALAAWGFRLTITRQKAPAAW